MPKMLLDDDEVGCITCKSRTLEDDTREDLLPPACLACDGRSNWEREED